jgi:hypothetical protein
MKICFNGWFSGFLDKTNPGLHIDFFLNLFEKIYNIKCEIGDLNNSDILCEFDMLISSKTLYNTKKWKHTYLFSGESKLLCNKANYDVVLWGERNYKNVVNVPLFIPYIYTNNFLEKLENKENVTIIPPNDICVIISNSGGINRNLFLNELEKHFSVTYAGNYKNNIGENIKHQYNTHEFINFVGKYKFIVSMENSREDTYITEKIIHGLLANTIPIYWGSTRVHDYIKKERFLNLKNEDMNEINIIIQEIKEIKNNPDKWLQMVNQPNFNFNFNNNNNNNNKLDRTIDKIAQDIRCLLNNECWNNISKIYCVNNPIFEPNRHVMLQNMFYNLKINKDYVSYISPTYKHTITTEKYNKHTQNQLVRHLRSSNMSKGELSLFLNYKANLEDIVKNYKDGLFLIFESDVILGNDINKLNDFLGFIKDKEFDLIHLGIYSECIFYTPLPKPFKTGYRNDNNYNNDIEYYVQNNTKTTNYIEDITNKNDKFRVIQKFHTRCTDSFLWKYEAIVKFLNFMNSFEDYSSPFDYYMCNFFEKNINFKHYWSVNEFFKQGSNLGLTPSTLRNDI